MKQLGQLLPLLAFVGFSLRLIITGATIGDAIALFGFAALYGFHLFLSSKKEEPINDKFKSEIEALKLQVSSLHSANALKAKFK